VVEQYTILGYNWFT